MLDVYDFVTGLSYDNFDHQAKEYIQGHHFLALQNVCAFICEIQEWAGLEVLYFFLDEIITDEYKVNPAALECFLDVLPNVCEDEKNIAVIQRQLWELGNLIQSNARRLVFQDGPIGEEGIEATRAAACYIFAQVKQHIKKAAARKSDCGHGPTFYFC